MKKIEMKPLSQVMEDLRQKGYTCDFHMREDDFVCADTNEVFQPEDLTIVQTYRFEGESDPGDMSILYAIEAANGDKGQCVDAYGTNASRRLGEFIKRVKIQEREGAY
jgi:hypothetical protein